MEEKSIEIASTDYLTSMTRYGKRSKHQPNQQQTRIPSVSDAAALWHLDTSTIRRAIKDGRLVQDLDCYKLGKQWTVTKAAMTRLYGTPKEKDQG